MGFQCTAYSNTGIYTVKRTLISAIALGGLTVSAQAADLSVDSVKDPIPDTLSWQGVTIYGTIDVGAGYTSNGLAPSGTAYETQAWNIFGENLGKGGQTNLINNALSQSTIGIKIEENIGYGFQAIGKLDTGFNPISGQLSDACGSLIEAANVRAGNLLGTTNALVPTYGDGSRCGQAFNGVAYGGVSNPLYGTLTFGRQNSLDLDATAAYDPMALSYALSLIGWSGTPGGGIGSTETARWDNSAKYVFSYGPIHAAAAYANGSTADTSIHDYGASGDIGITYGGLSVDALYTYESGAVNSLFGLLPGLTSVAAVTGVSSPSSLLDTPITNNTNQMYYYLTDNSAWAVMGKYTFDFGAPVGLKDGGSMKDAPVAAPPSSKLTIFGGFQEADISNYNGAPGGSTIGGYQLSFLNNILLTTKVLDTAWAGLKYEIGPWAFTGAYYYLGQNSFSEINNIGTSLVYNPHTTPAPTPSVGGCTVNAAACSGQLNQVSFLIDYTFNKHFDVYTGVSYQEIGGGLAHSFLTNDPYNNTTNTTVVSGLRVKF